jgi:hypothetical protein
MKDDVLDFVRKNPNPETLAGRLPKSAPNKQEESGEDSCAAFGYLRGLHERALAIEFRFRSGDSTWFPYSWIGSWRYNPSAGLLVKFTGDVVTLVWIQGSNLAAQVNQSGVNLTDRGLQRHRILWIREFDPAELRRAGEGEPTIDRVVVAEFDNGEELQEWLKTHAPAFARQP